MSLEQTQSAKADILERLRRFDNPMLKDAADEIARLRKENAEWVYAFHAVSCGACHDALWKSGPKCETAEQLLQEARRG